MTIPDHEALWQIADRLRARTATPLDAFAWRMAALSFGMHCRESLMLRELARTSSTKEPTT